jgi:hypothetical protein
MSVATLQRKLNRLEILARARASQDQRTLARLLEEPTRIMTAAGLVPDPWQEQLLRSQATQTLLLASRQSGKSSVAAALALRTALLRPRSPVLLLSPTLRQSGELFRKVVDLFNALGRPLGIVAESALRLEFANGSRVVALPGTEGTVRGFSGVALLVIDEAARVPDPLYRAVRPMLAVSQGRLVALSTPFGKRGWFHDDWHGTGEWERVRITAEQCPRIPAEFLAEERRALGERWFLQEYMCEFTECIDAVFSYVDIQAALADDVQPLFLE